MFLGGARDTIIGSHRGKTNPKVASGNDGDTATSPKSVIGGRRERRGEERARRAGIKLIEEDEIGQE